MQLVKKANDLIQAKYSLTKNEQRLILYLVSKITRDDADFKKYQFTYQELAELTEMHKSRLYAELATMAEHLLEKPICFLSKGGQKKSFCNWVSSFVVDNEEKTCAVKFDPDLKPYLLKLQSYFTSYNIKYISGFTSKHSFRIYELCKQYQGLKQREFGLVELKTILGLDNKYKDVARFKSQVINPAIADINAHSDLNVSVIYAKTRRTITSLTFDITNGLQACQNERQEAEILQEKKKQSTSQAKQAKIKKTETDWLKKWDKMSDVDRQNWGGDGKGFVNFRSKKGIWSE